MSAQQIDAEVNFRLKKRHPTKSKEEYEKEAIQKINAATLSGIQQGELASKKLHQSAKVAPEQETAAAIGKLKEKFDSTKNQVLDIVNNFGMIRSELQDLKSEYLQETN